MAQVHYWWNVLSLALVILPQAEGTCWKLATMWVDEPNVMYDVKTQKVYSCDDVCKNHSLTCNQSALDDLVNSTACDYMGLFAAAGYTCIKGRMKAVEPHQSAKFGAPYVHDNLFKDNMCHIGTGPEPTPACDAKPVDIKHRRLCPCNGCPDATKMDCDAFSIATEKGVTTPVGLDIADLDLTGNTCWYMDEKANTEEKPGLSCDALCAAKETACNQSAIDDLKGKEGWQIEQKYYTAGVNCKNMNSNCADAALCDKFGSPYIHNDAMEHGACGVGTNPSAATCGQVPVDRNHRRLCPCLETKTLTCQEQRDMWTTTTPSPGPPKPKPKPKPKGEVIEEVGEEVEKPKPKPKPKGEVIEEVGEEVEKPKPKPKPKGEMIEEDGGETKEVSAPTPAPIMQYTVKSSVTVEISGSIAEEDLQIPAEVKKGSFVDNVATSIAEGLGVDPSKVVITKLELVNRRLTAIVSEDGRQLSDAKSSLKVDYMVITTSADEADAVETKLADPTSQETFSDTFSTTLAAKEKEAGRTVVVEKTAPEAATVEEELVPAPTPAPAPEPEPAPAPSTGSKAAAEGDENSADGAQQSLISASAAVAAVLAAELLQ